ncbi:MAG: SsrA-binding protein [Crocinitomicaceae bacterium]|nr:SsrA-binding protein [Crocinitomicaceae bacterium]
MNYTFWKILSLFNKSLLPKIYRKPDLMKLTAFDKAIVGWKMLVTYKFLDAAKSKGYDVV